MIPSLLSSGERGAQSIPIPAAQPAQRDIDIMAPVGTTVHHNVANKVKRPIPPGIQTNGMIQSSKSSPSPSMSAKKPPSSAKQPPHSASERSITASTVRPINRARREPSSQILGRNSRNSAGLRSASMAADMAGHDEPPPYSMGWSLEVMARYI